MTTSKLIDVVFWHSLLKFNSTHTQKALFAKNIHLYLFLVSSRSQLYSTIVHLCKC